MIEQVTAVVVVAAGGVLEAGQAGPGGTAAVGEWWPGWPELYARQHEGPPYPV